MGRRGVTGLSEPGYNGWWRGGDCGRGGVDLGKGMGEMGWWCLFVLGIVLVNLLMNTMRQSVQCFEKVHDIGLADFYALVGVHVLA